MMQKIFPENPNAGYIVQLSNKEIFMYDGSFWNLLGGKFLSLESLRLVLNYLDAFDPNDSIAMIKADLESIFPELDQWEEIFIKNLIRTTKNIKRISLHT